MLKLARRAPVTTLSWLVLVVVYLGTHGMAFERGRPLHQLTRAWGAVETLNWVLVEGVKSEIVDPELFGPFDLWDGEWWRVPMSAVHHVNLLHLLMNLSFVVLCGPWLEARWGGWRYGLFLFGAALVSMPGEYLLGERAMGYSGVCCAIFGALLAIRPHDADLQARLTDDMILWTWASLVIMVVLTWADVARIANLAHFTGLGYGWLAGIIARERFWARSLFVLSHAALVVQYWFLVHPVWLGRYQWYEADLQQRQQRTNVASVDRLKTAVALDPTLTRVWRILADDALRRDDVLGAWDFLLQGLQHNPSEPSQWQTARRMWRRLATTAQREPALRKVQERFGGDADRWLAELRRIVPPPVLIAPDRPTEPTQKLAAAPVVPAVEWQPPPAAAWQWNDLPPAGPLPAVDPSNRHSAVEGELL